MQRMDGEVQRKSHKKTKGATMTSNSVSNANTLINNVEQVRKDLDTIEREYVRKVLFPGVKFLYGNNDLADGGRLHKHFIENCMNGSFKLGAGYITEKEDERNYLQYLWTHHVRERGLCKKWLSNRRSTVYTVMQHKFRSKWMCQEIETLLWRD